jgi:hypothetical protein|tara:strand:+ start:8132 stop:9130 length:999 start_codon:yes stop_codon:yes gene_type:complete
LSDTEESNIPNEITKHDNAKSGLENIIEENFYIQHYDDWVKNFALNLNDIWNESSVKVLSQNQSKQSAIVIGAGPSLQKNSHLEKLANSNYQGSIICTDRSLIPALKAGITPDKFSKFYVVTIDPSIILKKFYDDDIVNEYGKKINGLFSTVIHPHVVKRARDSGIKIYWMHALFDYHEGKKSFNQTSALMVRVKTHTNGLPAIQTGGNVGTAAWFVAWRILKCEKVCLVGINHSWDLNDPWEKIFAHSSMSLGLDKESPLFKRAFPKVFNPEFKTYCVLDPVFQYYSNALKEFITRSPEWLTTINATEGGCIFGDRIVSMSFMEFLSEYAK